MDQTAEAAANSDQIAYWNATAGETWASMQDLLDHQFQPISARVLQALAAAEGERVLDVGCGCGATTLAIAQAVGGGGRVLGADISRPMLAVARARIAQAGLRQAEAMEADAQAHAFEPGAFDAAFSRFGVMFFAQPQAAFANIRRAIRPGGRLAFVCWRPLIENPWMLVPAVAALQRLGEAPPAADPLAPGPFAFADPDRVRGILDGAGFADVSLTPFDQPIGPPSLEAGVALAMKVGPLGAVLREQPDKAPMVVDAIREALAPYVTPDGVRLPSATWIVQARNP